MTITEQTNASALAAMYTRQGLDIPQGCFGGMETVLQRSHDTEVEAFTGGYRPGWRVRFGGSTARTDYNLELHQFTTRAGKLHFGVVGNTAHFQSQNESGWWDGIPYTDKQIAGITEDLNEWLAQPWFEYTYVVGYYLVHQSELVFEHVKDFHGLAEAVDYCKEHRKATIPDDYDKRLIIIAEFE